MAALIIELHGKLVERHRPASLACYNGDFGTPGGDNLACGS